MFSVLASGTATTTQLGQFTMLYTLIATLLREDMPTGSSHYVAADGIIYTYTTGVSEPTPDPDVVSIVEAHTISGGTGRYADARGSFTLNRLANIVTGATTGSFHGTILLRPHH